MNGFKITDHMGYWFLRTRKCNGVRSHEISEPLKRVILAQYFLPYDHAANYIKSVAVENGWELEFINAKVEKPYIRFFRKLFRTT